MEGGKLKKNKPQLQDIEWNGELLVPWGQSQEKVSRRLQDLQQGREWADSASECSS